MRTELPSQPIVERELLMFLASFVRPLEAGEVYDPLAQIMRLSREQTALQRTDGRRAWPNLVQFARQRLVDQGFMLSADQAGHNAWVLSPKGRNEAYERERSAGLGPEELGL